MGEVVNEMMIGNAQDLITIETSGFTPGLYIVQMSSAVKGVVATASHRIVIQ
jgi:hypothetical protein